MQLALDNAKYIRDSLDDPADATGTDEEKMEFFRRVRDEIEESISLYLRGD